jgi:VanZ family protein
MPIGLRYWWPAIAWAALIFLFSTDLFSGENTAGFLIPLLRMLLPNVSIETIFAIHDFFRKAGHFIGYFVLSLLVLRGIRAGRSGWTWRWAALAWLLATGHAALDEIHQAFVPSRTGAVVDVLLDSVAALVGQVLAALRKRT